MTSLNFPQSERKRSAIMKRNLLAISAAVALALLAGPASSQSVTGTVTLNGFVAPRCGATYAANPTFSGTISLGELTQSNGTLAPNFSGSTSEAPAASALFLVGCNAGGSTVTLSATRLSNPATAGDPTASDDLDYTAEAKIALSAGGFATVDYTSGATLPPPTVQRVSGTFANIASGNFEVRVFGFSAEQGASSILSSGNYSSTITILVAPAS